MQVLPDKVRKNNYYSYEYSIAEVPGIQKLPVAAE
jgi:hypothetical protein